MGLERSLDFDKVFPLDGVCDELDPCEELLGVSAAGSKALGLQLYSRDMPLDAPCALELISRAGRPGCSNPLGSVSGGLERSTIFWVWLFAANACLKDTTANRNGQLTQAGHGSFCSCHPHPTSL
jgi:hypothetical protein